MTKAKLHEVLGMDRERADEIAMAVREAFSESPDPVEWIKKLMELFEVGPEELEAFACGWFAGRYAGVAEVFKVVEREMGEADRWARERRYPPSDGYA